jgi:hypothetical protein
MDVIQREEFGFGYIKNNSNSDMIYCPHTTSDQDRTYHWDQEQHSNIYSGATGTIYYLLISTKPANRTAVTMQAWCVKTFKDPEMGD